MYVKRKLKGRPQQHPLSLCLSISLISFSAIVLVLFPFFFWTIQISGALVPHHSYLDNLGGFQICGFFHPFIPNSLLLLSHLVFAIVCQRSIKHLQQRSFSCVPHFFSSKNIKDRPICSFYHFCPGQHPDRSNISSNLGTHQDQNFVLWIVLFNFTVITNATSPLINPNSIQFQSRRERFTRLQSPKGMSDQTAYFN